MQAVVCEDPVVLPRVGRERGLGHAEKLGIRDPARHRANVSAGREKVIRSPCQPAACGRKLSRAEPEGRMNEREITLIDGGRVTRAPARVEGSRLRIAPADLERGFGWTLEPQGLCKGDLCVTLRERRGLLDEGGVDLAVFAQTAGLPLAVDAGEGVAVLGESAAARGSRLASLDGARLHAPRSRGRRSTRSRSTAARRCC